MHFSEFCKEISKTAVMKMLEQKLDFERDLVNIDWILYEDITAIDYVITFSGVKVVQKEVFEVIKKYQNAGLLYDKCWLFDKRTFRLL